MGMQTEVIMNEKELKNRLISIVRASTKRMTQEKVAEIVGSSQGQVWRVINRKCPGIKIETLIRWVTRLGYKVYISLEEI